MGGGDLNLKKSWHPSTLKNMEKVWKAEQQDHQEKRRIAELKREIALERDREEMKSIVDEKSADTEKNTEKKLDWMYKGPNEQINREEYLLGRPIDKQFEQAAQNEKDAELNRPIKNHVEHECIPPSLRFFSGNQQVDLARKLQEDPLYFIKKKEMETRSQLLKNPVKLKKLQQLIALQNSKSKDNKKKTKRKKSSSDSDESETDRKLNDLLAAKYKSLKGKINEKDLIKSVKKYKKNKKKKKKEESSESSDDSSDSSDDSSDSSSESSDSSKKTSKHKSKKHKTKNHESKKSNHISRTERENKDLYAEYNDMKLESRREKNHHKYPRNYRQYSDEDKSSKKKLNNYGLMKADGSRVSPHRKRSFSRENLKNDMKSVKKDESRAPYKRQKLTEKEKELKRQEMMANASLRDKERARNVKRYEEQEKKELSNEKSFDKGFIQKHLAIAVNQETVASRIKSNINNIQRYKSSMDKNFAKR